jgi:replicative DNA helicase
MSSTDSLALYAKPTSEGSVIGSMILEPDLIDMVAEILPDPEAFTNRVYGDMYEIALSIYHRCNTLDMTLMVGELERRNLSKLDGYDPVKIATEVNYTHNCEIHAHEVARCFKVRKAWAVLAEGTWRLGKDPENVEEVLGITADEISSLAIGIGKSVVSPAGSVAREIQAAIESDEQDDSVPTGFRTIDGWLRGGVRPGEVMVIGGRPGQGKTALGVNIAIQAASAGYPSAVLSIEMSRKEIARRMMAYFDCPMNATKRDRARITEAVEVIQSLPLTIVDMPGGELSKVRGYVRSMSRTHGVRLFVLDYIQLVRTGKDSMEEYQRVTLASQAMKQIAREYGVAMLVLAQVNRDGGKKERPTMADLKGSGSLEQDADQIVLVHNPQNSDTPPELILAKHRNGQTGTVSAFYRAALTRFEDRGEKQFTNEPDSTW